MKRKAAIRGVGPDRIKANLAKQRPNNSYSPKTHYETLKFKCRDCGEECYWTAEQQRIYYEEWRGSTDATAVRCRPCRMRVRREKMEQLRRMKASPKNASEKHGT